VALSSELRSTLEKAIVVARDAAEEASRAALGVLALEDDRAPDHFDGDQRRLRVALRAEARQLGGFERLVEECGYEQWHRMLFARFLAENDLLIHPDHGVPVTLAECEEIAQGRGGTDRWLVASEFASAMLPGIFRSDDPVLQLTFAPEGQQRLEAILAGLPPDVFTSEDGLGWVYEHWQTKMKQKVNASERKIGGADIASVTQLFTENYMVRFLLENTLGAWWASHNPESPLVQEWEYLRLDDDGKPAAGSFPGWPEAVAEVTVMDPCCGSGHFLVTAFEMLRRMRMEAEGLTPTQAGDAVLRDNIFGLELDPRCTQIAAFALVLQAWKSGGYRDLTVPNVACSGISAKGQLEDWKKLAGGDERLERSLEQLHVLFSDAADLGSLIDPLREADGGLLVAEFREVAPLLTRALERERGADPSAAVLGRAAAGAARAASLLGGTYTLVTTNPPFLGRRRQTALIRDHCERFYSASKADLATCFVERGFAYCAPEGAVAMVTPQSWLYLTSYEPFRREMLELKTWNAAVLLGTGAFSGIGGEVVNVGLLSLIQVKPVTRSSIFGVDLTSVHGSAGKAEGLISAPIIRISQSKQLKNPNARLVLDSSYDGTSPRLSDVARCYQGTATGDDPRARRRFWELPNICEPWAAMQSSSQSGELYDGFTECIYWGELGEAMDWGGSAIRGADAWGRRGIGLANVGGLTPSLYLGVPYDQSCHTVIADDQSLYPALWMFAESGRLSTEVRKIDRQLKVTNATVEKVPFDAAFWRAVARKRFPEGLPLPSSRDPSQWLFAGHPGNAKFPFQASLPRLVGYRWPRQTGSEFPDCPALTPDGLEAFADEDGIVCIPSVRGERPAAERLRALLAAAFEDEWSSAKEADLLVEAGYTGKSLEQWLRDGFFEQHCQLFHQRPFVWQIWDGRKDGFSTFINYHRLDRATLEKLVYTYLGEWIRQQREAAAAGAPGADLRLAAAEELRQKLELILEGEQPYDIFVRWKPRAEQPMGWEPDLNDGVRLNIRPFVTAGVLRKNPKIKWGKDRGKDPESAPWYPVFKGDRINDHHLTLAEKRSAREAPERPAVTV
jgi:hypothetical protein